MDAPPENTRRRARLVPVWVWWTLGVVVTLVVVSVLGVLIRDRALTRQVPSVAGMDVEQARAALEKSDLNLRQGDSRFSPDVPKGLIVDQDPEAGSEARAGSDVVVAVSAGSESFAMPQVVGAQADAVTKLLEAKGLSVEVENVSSDQPTGTVLASFPAAGATVTTSDVVRLSVASGSSSSELLLPVDLTGRKVVIDPAPSLAKPDVTLEVARRLQSLLQASGGQVVVTRSAADKDVSDAARAKKAKAAKGTLVVVLSVDEVGTEPLRVMAGTSPAKGPGGMDSKKLAASLLEALAKAKLAPKGAAPLYDPVLTAVSVPGSEVVLGSVDSQADRARFQDPEFIDSVARGLYKGIADALSAAG